jgi:type II secretory pathway predicted ATPase ExeA/cytoskeletal protein CcmA (bactofilin family)
MNDENLSIINQSMVVTGTIECHGQVILEGTFEGIFVGRNLDIGKTGKIVGDIRAKSIDCAGHTEGCVVTEVFTLRSTGRHIGTVETQRLTVEPGAILDCALQSGGNPQFKQTVNAQEGVTLTTIDLSPLLSAFKEGVRPCCMDIPWSARLDVYTQLLEILDRDKPLVKVVGERGSGKTLLQKKLYSSLPSTYETIYTTVGDRSVGAVLQEVAGKLDVPEVKELTQGDLLSRLRMALEARRMGGQRVLLLIDEVEEIHPAAIEGLVSSLTSALDEQKQNDVLQMILFGTNEMEAKLVDAINLYFEDETNCQFFLEPLTIKDTADYLRHCLQLAAAGNVHYSTALLPYDTIRKIHSLSRGNMAEINRLADKALRNACAANASEIYAKFI